MSQLPGLALRALLGLVADLVLGLWHWCVRPENRRTLKILPFVLLAHVLLVWLLIQNRWIVMSNSTITLMPPIMASILLSDSETTSNAASTKPSKWGHDGAADELSLKPDRDLSFGAPRVARSVPWLTTEQLPDLRGNSRDARAQRNEEHTAPQRQAETPKPAARPRHAKARPQATARTQAPVTLKIPPPPPTPEVLRIPPPPDLAQLPLMPEPLPAPPPTPPADIPPIPEPANKSPKEIPPLWQDNPKPPPVLTKIAPPPPQLKLIPVPPPPDTVAAPVTAPSPTVEPAPAVPPAAPPVAVEHPRPPKPAPAPVETPPPNPVAATVAPPQAQPEPPPPAPTPPLTLTPATALPSPAANPPAATTVIVSPAPAASTTDGANANSAPSVAPTAAATEARNPMVVEVPRYRQADSNTAAPPGPGANGSNSTRPSDSGARSGPDGAGSRDGSVLGLGAAAPLPLPHTSEPVRGQAKPLNLTLPRIDMFRHREGEMSLSEMANAQLRRGDARTPLAAGIDSAENPDCLAPQGKDQAATGLLAAPVTAYKAMTGKCK